MKTTLFGTGLAALAALVAPDARAGTVELLAGDIDCFGLGAGASACSDGAFATIPAFDNATAGDPAGTDAFGTLGSVGLAFGPLDLGGATVSSVSVEIRVAGIDIFIEPSIGDANQGATFVFNGGLIGTFHQPVVTGSSINQRAITTLMFSITPASLIAGPGNSLVITPETDFGLAAFEAYGVDYARLTVVTADPPAAVPLPASAPLLGAASLALAAAARRRRR